MTEVNVPLLRKAVEWAEAEHARGYEHSQWFQATWMVPKALFESYFGDEKSPECGTCYCIAGYVNHLDGNLVEEGKQFFDQNGKFVNPSEYAAGLLGLSSGQADRLFYAGNSIEMVRSIAEEIAGERL